MASPSEIGAGADVPSVDSLILEAMCDLGACEGDNPYINSGLIAAYAARSCACSLCAIAMMMRETDRRDHVR